MVIRVRGTGNVEATTPLTVTVTPIEGSYTLSVTPSPLTLVQGTSVSARVRTERMGGFTNSVSVVVDFAPAGMSVQYFVSDDSYFSDELRVTVPANTPAGDYTIVLRGRSVGSVDVITTLTVRVRAP